MCLGSYWRGSRGLRLAIRSKIVRASSLFCSRLRSIENRCQPSEWFNPSGEAYLSFLLCILCFSAFLGLVEKSIAEVDDIQGRNVLRFCHFIIVAIVNYSPSAYSCKRFIQPLPHVYRTYASSLIQKYPAGSVSENYVEQSEKVKG